MIFIEGKYRGFWEMERTGGSSAGAVDTAMLGTGSAGERELFFQRLTRPMDADGGVAGSDAHGFGESFERVFSKIDAANNLAVLRLDGGEHVLDASADDILCTLVRRCFGDEIAGPSFESAVFGGAVTIVVDDGIAQNAVEPGDGGLVFVQRRGFFHCANVGALQDIFGSRGSIDAALEKLEEPAPLKDKIVDGFSLHWLRCSLNSGAEGSLRARWLTLLVRCGAVATGTAGAVESAGT